MIAKKSLKMNLRGAVFGFFFAILGVLTGVVSPVLSEMKAYAEPATEEQSTEQVTKPTAEEQPSEQTEGEHRNGEQTERAEQQTEAPAEENTKNDSKLIDSKTFENICHDNLGEMGWVVCPVTEKVSDAVDWLYEKIEGILEIKPIKADDSSPIYEIWKYCRGVTNVVFIIFLLVVIYSQLTGVGISNYGLKKALPKLIVAAILVNLSFLICQLLVDVSNIVGDSLRGVFTSVEESVLSSYQYTPSVEGASREMKIQYAEMYGAMAGGVPLAVGGGLIAFESGAFWLLIPVVLGALVAVVTGLITIALRQAVVALLIMIAPLAFVANILPNTEQWFKKWWDLLKRMLVFYPVFSLLFGASSLAGFAIIMSAQDGFGVILGTAVQIFPLFFSWKLMRMSGTFLGDINAKLRGLAEKPLARNRAWAESRRAQTRAYYTQYGVSSKLLKALDNRKELKKETMARLQKMRKDEANIYVQSKFSNGYDGTKADGKENNLKPSKYTRIAKDASNLSLASETATMDTQHVISEYGKYFVNKDVRKAAAKAEKARDKATLERLRATDAEYRRASIGANNYLEFSRAQMTKENDEESDFNFMVSQYLDASMNYDPKADLSIAENKEKYKKYHHYIVSSAGGLGEAGQTRVLGKIIAKAAAVESNQRRDIAIVAAKFPPDKRNFRNFLFNYYIDDDGYATDKDGNRIEKMRDYLRVNDPDKLVMWDKYDENGPYYDWYDVNGRYVTRIYKKDKSAIKELMSNFDAPINDPINNMLAIHAGIKEQPNSEHPVLRNMGLDGFRTTVGRALLSAPFKEKNAAFSPMVAEMVKRGYIQNYAQEYLAYLDSFNKATKPGAFNVQDADAINMFADMMDPTKWDELFPTDLIRGYKNVNGEDIYGIRYDENGKAIKVSAEEATREELMERVKQKYIYPSLPKITAMMARQTQNTMDNQKPGAVAAWKKLKDTLDKYYGDGKMVEVDPYQQDGDMRVISKDIREAIYTMDADGNKHKFNVRGGKNSDANEIKTHKNHAAEIYEIYNSTLDADDFAVAVSDYCRSHSELAWIADQVQDYLVSAGYGVDKEQLYEFVESLLAYVDYD